MLAFPTPRRPAAQRRRAPSQSKDSPPPPYMRGLPDDGGNDDSFFGTKTSREDHSKEDIGSLLLRADGIIRQRERELSFTSDFSRELHDSSRSLKTTHQALLSRISASATPVGSPMTSPQPTPHVYSSSLPQSELSQAVRSHSSTPSEQFRRSRRVSISPAELARLSDQNAELLAKVEQLQEESELVDNTGKRRLGKLEEEIRLLRQELDEARARSEALEEHNLILQRDSEEAQLRKLEREERINNIRHRGQDQSNTVIDYAPSSAVFLPSFLAKRGLDSSAIDDFIPSSKAHGDSSNADLLSGTPAISRSNTPMSEATGSQRDTLLSQLMLKVQELEEANEQIGRHQQDTTSKLRAAQLEAESIRRLYSYLDENTEIEIQDQPAAEAAQPSLDSFAFPGDSHPKTIRFRSLRRTIDGDVSQLDFESGIRDNMHSTMRSVAAARVPKRKGLAGLFDIAAGSASAAGSSTIYETSQTDADDSHVRSPSLASDSFIEDSGERSRHRTLGSELGSEYENSFASGNSPFSHYHTSSIYGLGSVGSSVPSVPASPSERFTQPGGPGSFPFPNVPKSSGSIAGPSTPGNDRMHRLSQTLRSRTNRWVNHRMSDSFQSLRLPPDTLETSTDLNVQDLGVGISPLPSNESLSRVFRVVDSALERFTNGAVPEAALAESTSTATIMPSQEPEVVTKRRKLAMFALEIWLWLQFAVVVLLFIYAMAKRGPKSILKDADRKRKAA